MRAFLRSFYCSYSKQPELSLLFVSPLWLLYEIFAYRLNHSWLGSFRTGTDFLLKKGFDAVGLHPSVAVILPIVALFFFFLKRGSQTRRYLRRPSVFAFMFLESLVYALVFGLIVGKATTWILSFGLQEVDQSKVATLVASLGSGPYEEFFFRFVLVLSMLAFLKNRVRKMTHWKYIVYVPIVIMSSLAFAGFHYLYVFAEPFGWTSFAFRFFAGIVLSLLFIFRGLGISAYTHSLYNILLVIRP